MNEILFYLAIVITFCFAFVNGFHDGGNVVATIICSRSMRPATALLWAAIAEFLGPLLIGTAVAATMAGSILKTDFLAQLSSTTIYIIVIAAVAAAIAWKLPTWFIGLPSSGSHALIGGLVGSGLVALGPEGVSFHQVLIKVVLPMLLTPLVGIVLGFIVFSVLKVLFGRAHRGIGSLFEAMQKPTMFLLAASHGSNDAQKSMGIIALVLAAQTGAVHGPFTIPHWVVFGCALALAVGLTLGSWRIIKSIGLGICRIEPVHSFASQFSAGFVIFVASLFGGPVSTSQIVASSIMGVGAARRLPGVRWSAAGNIAYAWLLTVPVCILLGAAGFWILKHIFL